MRVVEATCAVCGERFNPQRRIRVYGDSWSAVFCWSHTVGSRFIFDSNDPGPYNVSKDRLVDVCDKCLAHTLLQGQEEDGCYPLKLHERGSNEDEIVWAASEIFDEEEESTSADVREEDDEDTEGE